jgi:hypothetical protein
LLLLIAESPKPLQTNPVREVRPKVLVADDLHERRARHLLNDRLPAQKIQTLGTIEGLQKTIFVEMLDRAAVVVDIAYQIVMTAADA